MPFVEADKQKRIEYGETWADFFLALDTDGSWDAQLIIEEARDRDSDFYTGLMDIGLGLLQEKKIVPRLILLSTPSSF